MSKDAPKGNVRLCAIGRISDRAVIASYLHFTAGPEAKKYLDVAQKILKSDKVLSQKCANVPNAVEESSCLMQADANFMYVAFVHKSYPERTVFEFLGKVRKEFMAKEGAGAEQAPEGSLSKACKPWLLPLCAQYDDISAVNKVAEVQAKVNDVTSVMEDNVRAIIANQERVEDIEMKAEEMRDKAQVFKSGATQLASKMWWQNAKMWIIIGVVSFIFLLIVVLSLCPSCRGG
mmetsp:Transcript_45888/g.96111  ORF Transcript_45888/g.96111 Transcript_45888/m.96111 type:complete len:233 (-) Transcript_45888:27-725(-)